MKSKFDYANEIHKAAMIYEKELRGKTFLYVFDKQYIEVVFSAENFRHLVGVPNDSGYKSANAFYKTALNGKIEVDKLRLDSVYKKKTCRSKLDALSHIKNALHESGYIMFNYKTNTIMFSYAHTHLETFNVLCFEVNKANAVNRLKYFPKSIRNNDKKAFERATKYSKIDFIFRKDSSGSPSGYNVICQMSSSADKIPEEVIHLLDDNLIKGFGFQFEKETDDNVLADQKKECSLEEKINSKMEIIKENKKQIGDKSVDKEL